MQPPNRPEQRHCRHLHLAWVYRLFAPWRHLQPDRLRRDGIPVHGGEFDRPAIRVGLVPRNMPVKAVIAMAVYGPGVSIRYSCS